MKIIKKVKKYGASYIIRLDKQLVDDGLIEENEYYIVTLEKCPQ